MKTQVDILAIIQNATDCLNCSNSARDIRAGIALTDVRAAVAELIDATNALLNATGRASCSWPIQSPQREAWNRTDTSLRLVCGGDLYNGTTDHAVHKALVGGAE